MLMIIRNANLLPAVIFLQVCIGASQETESCASVHPDNSTDIGDTHAANENFSRPPAVFSSFTYTGIGKHSANLSWAHPTYQANSMGNATVCFHSLAIVSHNMKDGKRKTTHMNIFSNATAAHITSLPSNSSINILLKACFVYPKNTSLFICSTSTNLTIQTLNDRPTSSSCREGFHWIQDTPRCELCDCNGNSNDCDKSTGICQNCKNHSKGMHCESCVAGYSMNEEIECVPDQSGDSKPEQSNNTTTSVTTTNITPSDANTPLLTTRDGSGRNDDQAHSLTLIVVICALLGMVILSLLMFITYKKYRQCKRKPSPFWTIQLQNERVSFSETLEPHYCSNEDNRLIDNDYSNRHPFANQENPYRPLTHA